MTELTSCNDVDTDTDNISINLPSIDRSHDALDCARCESAENETPCLRQPRL